MLRDKDWFDMVLAANMSEYDNILERYLRSSNKQVYVGPVHNLNFI